MADDPKKPEDKTRVQFVLPPVEDGGGTQAPTLEAGTLEAGTVDSNEKIPAASSVVPDDDRYGGLELIGKGGMGAVFGCRDQVVGREVAMKVMRSGSLSRRARFLREARVQGRLEHPAVLPVYDLGEDDDGVPFFTMRRLDGVTLARVIRAHRSGDVDLVGQFPMRAMLAAFARVCSAVDYAHSHGVVHRDLKPDNIMLGDFGQVYVIDWGVAKITGDPDSDPEPDAEPDTGDEPDAEQGGPTEEAFGRSIDLTRQGVPTEEAFGRSIDLTPQGVPTEEAFGRSIDLTPQGGPTEEAFGRSIDLTAAGVLGTPGYLSPEQARGEDVDGRADIYALGCILFEILTLEPLHLGPGASAKLASTLETAAGRPRRRSGGAQVAPELDELCARATALELGDRIDSARELYRAVDAFLAGHRDEERRKKLAATFAAEAEQALTATADDTLISRRQALRSASQALAYDPDNERAQATLVSLLIEPMQELPAEVAEQRRALEVERRRREARVGTWLYMAWFGFLWVIPFLGAKSGRFTLALIGVLLLNIGVTLVYSRTASHLMRVVAIVGNGMVLAVTTRFLGSFVMVPALGVISVVLLVLQSENRRDHALAVVAIIAALLGPLALEAGGVIDPIYRFVDGAMVIDSAAVALPRGPTLLSLSLLVATAIFTAAWAVSVVRRQSSELERQLLTRTWLLRQTLPDAIRGG